MALPSTTGLELPTRLPVSECRCYPVSHCPGADLDEKVKDASGKAQARRGPVLLGWGSGRAPSSLPAPGGAFQEAFALPGQLGSAFFTRSLWGRARLFGNDMVENYIHFSSKETCS